MEEESRMGQRDRAKKAMKPPFISGLFPNRIIKPTLVCDCTLRIMQTTRSINSKRYRKLKDREPENMTESLPTCIKNWVNVTLKDGS